MTSRSRPRRIRPVPWRPTGGNTTVIGPAANDPLTNIPIGPTGTIGGNSIGTTVDERRSTRSRRSTTTRDDVHRHDADARSARHRRRSNTARLTTVHLSSIPRGTGASGGRDRRASSIAARAARACGCVATIADNTTTTYTDTTPNATLGAAPPAVNTATLRVIPLTAIPLGNSLVTARKVYRTPANTGGGTLKLVATIADNTTTDVHRHGERRGPRGRGAHRRHRAGGAGATAARSRSARPR